MKYCEEYAVLIQDALDGELPAEERQRLEEHLEQCPGCRAYYEAMRAIDESFSDMDAQPPRRLHESIMQAVAETPQQKKRATNSLPLSIWKLQIRKKNTQKCGLKNSTESTMLPQT